MAAVILVWNPERWNRWNYPAAVDQVDATGLHVEPWDGGPGAGIPAGTEAWLLLQGRPRSGLIGHGAVVRAQPGPAEPAPGHPGPAQRKPGPSRAVPRAKAAPMIVAFDALLPLGDQLEGGRTGLDVLAEAAAAPHRNGTHGPVLRLGASEEAEIRILWTSSGPASGPDPTKPAPGTYPETAVSRVPVNRYEQDPEARRACISYHGTRCMACGFSFELTYGAAGKDFADVHHIVPASRLGSGYELDPVTDLVPLCANCHAMAHHGVSTPRTVAELRRLTAAAGFLAGTTVTSGELEAEREARRMLGL